MRTFEIVSATGRRKIPVGWLDYDPEKKSATIRLAETAEVGHVPAMFERFLELGERRIGSDWTLKWVQERVAPPSRHNIDEILVAANAEEYNPYLLLFATEGRCAQDDFFLREAVTPSYEYAVVQLRQDIGADVARARREAGMTQQDLAYRSGIQQSMLSRLERGQVNPTVETLQCLAAAMGKSLTISFGS